MSKNPHLKGQCTVHCLQSPQKTEQPQPREKRKRFTHSRNSSMVTPGTVLLCVCMCVHMSVQAKGRHQVSPPCLLRQDLSPSPTITSWLVRMPNEFARCTCYAASRVLLLCIYEKAELIPQHHITEISPTEPQFKPHRNNPIFISMATSMEGRPFLEE